MDHQEIFSESARKHFAYLMEEFDFAIVEDQYHQRGATCMVAFQNKTRYVKLNWGLKDQALYFGVYRVLSNGQPAPYQDYGANQFYISRLAEHYERGIDMSFLHEMAHDHPDWPRLLDEKIGANAQLLRKYGSDILAGREWFDWMGKKLISAASLSDAWDGTPPKIVTNSVSADQHRSVTRGYYPLESSDAGPTLPMWIVLLIVGGVAVGLAAAFFIAFRWLLGG